MQATLRTIPTNTEVQGSQHMDLIPVSVRACKIRVAAAVKKTEPSRAEHPPTFCVTAPLSREVLLAVPLRGMHGRRNSRYGTDSRRSRNVLLGFTAC